MIELMMFAFELGVLVLQTRRELKKGEEERYGKATRAVGVECSG